MMLSIGPDSDDDEDKQEAREREVVGLVQEVTNNNDFIDQQSVIDPAKYSDTSACEAFSACKEHVMTELLKPLHGDFGQALIDAKKYNEIAAYNTVLLIHLFSMLSFEQFVNKCYMAIMKLATTLPDSIWWKDPNALPVPTEKTELVLHNEGYVQAGFFTYLLSVIQDESIPLIAANSDMSDPPRCYSASVMNSGSSFGVQVALSKGSRAALKNVIADPMLTCCGLNPADEKRSIPLLTTTKTDDSGDGETPRTHKGFSVLSLAATYNQGGRWALTKYNFSHLASNDATPPKDHLDFNYMSLDEALAHLSAEHMLYDVEAPNYDDDKSAFVRAIEALIASDTPAGVVRCAPQLMHNRYMEPLVTHLFSLYTFEKDSPSEQVFADYNLVDSIYAFRDDESSEEPKKWHCITPCASSLKEDGERRVTTSTVKNMFKTGKMTYFTYVTLRYYRMVAKGDDAARLPTMQEFWDMDEDTRKEDLDLVQTLQKVYKDMHAQMNGMSESKQVLNMFDKVEKAVSAKREMDIAIVGDDDDAEIIAQQFKKAKANVHKEVEKVQQIMVTDQQFPHPLMKVSFNGMTQAFRSSQQVDKLKLTIGIDDMSQQQTDLYVSELVHHVNALLGKRQHDEIYVENMELKNSIQKLTDEIEILQKAADRARAEADLAEEAASTSKKTFDETLMAATQVLDDGEADEAAGIVDKAEADQIALKNATAEAKKKKDEAQEAEKKLADTSEKKKSLRTRLQVVQQEAAKNI